MFCLCLNLWESPWFLVPALTKKDEGGGGAVLMLQSEEVTSDHRRVTPSMPGSTVSNYDLSPSPTELCVTSQSPGKTESLCPLSRASPPALHTIAPHKSPADSSCSARPDERPSS